MAPDLTTNINMDDLLPFLQKHCLLTSDEEFHLGHIMHSSGKKAQMLISYLKKKGDGSLQKFLCCLNSAHKHSGHKGIADKLKQIMQSKGLNCNNFCSPDCEQQAIQLS